MNGDHKESFKKDGCDLQVQELLLTSGRKRSVLYSSPAATSAVGALFFDAFVKETKQAYFVILSPSSVILTLSKTKGKNLVFLTQCKLREESRFQNMLRDPSPSRSLPRGPLRAEGLRVMVSDFI